MLAEREMEQKLDRAARRIAKMTSPFALQSIFSGWSIAEHPPFTRPVVLPTKERELRRRANPKRLTTGKSSSGAKDSIRDIGNGLRAGGRREELQSPYGLLEFLPAPTPTPKAKTQTRGHFYLGSNRTFLLWLDKSEENT